MADPRIIASRKPSKTIATSSGLNALLEARRALSAQNPLTSRVGAGMRSLVSISKAVGLGGKLPFTVDNIPSNVSWVLNQVGINTQSLMTVSQFNRPVVDAAELAARQVAVQVHAGTFKEGDIRRYQPQFERLNELSQHVFVPKLAAQYDMQVSPYAMDLFAFAPKYKFLFVVQFTFNAPYMQDSNFQRQFAFLIKKSSRPAVKYNLEDVNYYNHRTKYTAKAELEEMSMSFYDDGKNNVDAFFSAYTRAMSPILNYSDHNQMFDVENEGLKNNRGQDRAVIPGIQDQIPVSSKSSGSTGALVDDNKTVIKTIRLFQIYDYGRKVNIFNFFNPRLSSLDLDDVDMASSEINMMDIKFTYDSMYMEMDKTLEEAGIPDITNVGKYNIRNNDSAVPKVDRVTYADVFSNQPMPQKSVGSINTPGDGSYIAPDLGLTGTTPLIPGGLSSALDNVGVGKININKTSPSYKPPTTQPTKSASSSVGNIIDKLSSLSGFGKKLF